MGTLAAGQGKLLSGPFRRWPCRRRSAGRRSAKMGVCRGYLPISTRVHTYIYGQNPFDREILCPRTAPPIPHGRLISRTPRRRGLPPSETGRGVLSLFWPAKNPELFRPGPIKRPRRSFFRGGWFIVKPRILQRTLSKNILNPNRAKPFYMISLNICANFTFVVAYLLL